MQDPIQPFLVSFLIGLLIGIDRERSLPQGMKGLGVRSFTIISLLGTLTAYVNDMSLTIIISSFIFLATLLNYHYTAQKQEEAKSLGITTGFAAAIVYVLGVVSLKNPYMAAIIGGAILVILLGRETLHTFAREKLKPSEISAVASLVIIVLCVMVFLPNNTVDPWDLFNPRRFGILVAVITLIQFSGYVAIRVFGDQLGLLLMGFFGGLVSSTAVVATLPAFVKKHPSRSKSAAAAIVLATVGMFVEFTILILVAAPDLFLRVAIPVIAMMFTGVVIALSMYHQDKNTDVIETPKNPLDFRSIIYLSLVIGCMIIGIAATKKYVGTEGVQILTFLAGLFELHGVTLATATLYHVGKISLHDSTITLYLAITASFVTKYALLLGLSRNRFALITSALLTLMLASGVTVVLLSRLLYP